MISVSNLGKDFGDRTLFADASFQLNPASATAWSAPTAPARRRFSAS